MARKRQSKTFNNLEITGLATHGKSVAKAPDGRVVFIKYVAPGDVVDVQTTKKRKAYYEARVIKYHKKSALRVTPVCSHFGLCGGCQWQHLSYSNQLIYKQKEVIANFKKIGQLDFPPPLPIIPAANPLFYRNKMEFSFTDNRWLSADEIASKREVEERRGLGFHIPGMWDKVLNIDTCYLQADPSNAIRSAIRDFSIEQGYSFFNLRQQTGLLRGLMIRTSSKGDLMVLIQFFDDEPLKRNELLDFLSKRFPEITSLLYAINSKCNDSIYDLDIKCFKGNDYIEEQLEAQKFKINAKSFFQTHTAQAMELYKVVNKFASLTGKELVYDLYSGTGTIAQVVSKGAKEVIGIESVPEAVDAARENARINKTENTSFYVGDMTKVFTEKFIEKHGSPHVVITDPPREGMHKKIVDRLLEIKPERIIYVSCNSATQARDLSSMKTAYRILKMQTVDMFPQTHHIENVVLLEKH